jgi:hypothetical protein
MLGDESPRSSSDTAESSNVESVKAEEDENLV